MFTLTKEDEAVLTLKGWAAQRLCDIFYVEHLALWPGGFYTCWANTRTPDGYQQYAYIIEPNGEVIPFRIGG